MSQQQRLSIAICCTNQMLWYWVSTHLFFSFDFNTFFIFLDFLKNLENGDWVFKIKFVARFAEWLVSPTATDSKRFFSFSFLDVGLFSVDWTDRTPASQFFTYQHQSFVCRQTKRIISTRIFPWVQVFIRPNIKFKLKKIILNARHKME